ncbi:MAG: hypothetical protein EBQ96_09135 [Proteobacteria bacterium]|nr:hypothetical protein [Pseudomonadota bacterium]
MTLYTAKSINYIPNSQDVEARCLLRNTVDVVLVFNAAAQPREICEAALSVLKKTGLTHVRVMQEARGSFLGKFFGKRTKRLYKSGFLGYPVASGDARHEEVESRARINLRRKLQSDSRTIEDFIKEAHDSYTLSDMHRSLKAFESIDLDQKQIVDANYYADDPEARPVGKGGMVEISAHNPSANPAAHVLRRLLDTYQVGESVRAFAIVNSQGANNYYSINGAALEGYAQKVANKLGIPARVDYDESYTTDGTIVHRLALPKLTA